MTRSQLLYGVALPLTVSLSGQPALAQNNIVAGQFVVEAPTLSAIGVEWKIVGDKNRNSAVDVSYRRRGEQQWRQALPLMRIQHEIINAGRPPHEVREAVPEKNDRGNRENPFHYDAGNMFAGSILNLQADTEYEARFVLSDADGVTGEKEKIVSVRTRKEPQPAKGGKVYHVYPIEWKGPKQQPAFTGLMRAYNMGASGSDFAHAFTPRVQPGDVILVHAGLYQTDRFHYLAGMPRPGWNALAEGITGTYYLTQSGTPDRPIVIKAAGDGEVIFDGAGNAVLFNLLAASHNYFEGITVRNTDTAFLLGWKRIMGSNGFTLKNSRLYDIGRAVTADWSGSRDHYISDNIIIGRKDPSKMMGWSGEPWKNLAGYPELLLSDYAVKLYGQGHVVAHNYVANFHDGIDIQTYGEPDGTPNMTGTAVTGPTELDERKAASIDFHNNDIYNMGDNCIEADGGVHNIRVFENRCFNVADQALTAQPILGGPLYFYRNLVYNAPKGGPLKFNHTPAGVLVYQNTFVAGDVPGGEIANVHLRNNLVLGRGTKDPMFVIDTTTNYSTSDYNGFSANNGGHNFEWNSPKSGVAADYSYPHKLTVRRFKTLKDYADATGQDRHSILVGYDVFNGVPMADDNNPQRLYNPEDMDFRLRRGSVAIDAGVSLPTINDGHTGRAPDLGAFELDQKLPHFGPRSEPPGAFNVQTFQYRSWNGPHRKGVTLIPDG